MKDDNKKRIVRDNLSEQTRRVWDWLQGLSIPTLIFGVTTLLFSVLINEGILTNPSNNWLYIVMAILTLVGSLLNLGLSIGILCVEWPKTKNMVKTGDETVEDEKLYAYIKADPTIGICMSVFYLLNIITLFVSRSSSFK